MPADFFNRIRRELTFPSFLSPFCEQLSLSVIDRMLIKIDLTLGGWHVLPSGLVVVIECAMNTMSVALQDRALPNGVQYKVRLGFAHTLGKILPDFHVLTNGREYLSKLVISDLKQTEGGVSSAVDNLNVSQFGTRTIDIEPEHNSALRKQRKALWTDLNAFIRLLQK